MARAANSRRASRAPSPGVPGPSPGAALSLEEPEDLALRIDVDVLAARSRGQSGHGPHLAREGRDEAGTGGEAHLADRHAKAARPALEGRVVRQRVLALGHA